MFEKLFGSKRQEQFGPRMPEVDEPPTLDEVFDRARKAAGEDGTTRHVVVVTPGRMLMLQPCPTPGSMSPQQVAAIEQMISSKVKRNIAAIACTELTALKTDISKAIPFFGILVGFAYIGHSVWVFEGHASALASGCRHADVLIVDGGMVPFLANEWVALASSAMNTREIYVHDRATFAVRKVTE